jgi:hypothetical protein
MGAPVIGVCGEHGMAIQPDGKLLTGSRIVWRLARWIDLSVEDFGGRGRFRSVPVTSGTVQFR